ncbi:MAG: gamma-glutamyl-gamma-aminobutyrate hydrolase family protein [Clostridia bacterium]|nr:gamma-glutamyl-gamma-aminobutyrate hydrolase family protein [Clostridia bacterium]
MKKPFIGIVPNRLVEEKERTEVNYWLNDTYVDMVEAAGGAAYILPYSFKNWELLDGLLLAGGHDVMPETGGYTPGDSDRVIHPWYKGRDDFERTALEEAEQRSLPVLGICRGCQIMNSVYGGILEWDIPAAGFAENHVISPFTKEGCHPILPEKNTLVEKLLNGRTTVCSSHHQMVKVPGRGFRITMRSPEGVNECIEHESGRMLGLQTHPERMEWNEPFDWLIALAKEKMQEVRTEKPLIGLLPNIKMEDDDPSEITYRLNETYITPVEEEGGIAVILPLSFDDYERLDGVIITGGPDVMPDVGRYTPGPDATPLPEYYRRRDDGEAHALKEAERLDLPVLGICRGEQMMNSYYGGVLEWDIPAAGYKESHELRPVKKENCHPITAEKGSLIEKLLNGRTTVDSGHHQMVKVPGKGFRITAYAPENVVECIEHESGRMLGIQAHPERMEWNEPFNWLNEKALELRK